VQFRELERFQLFKFFHVEQNKPHALLKSCYTDARNNKVMRKQGSNAGNSRVACNPL